jgi:hypothetical protein
MCVAENATDVSSLRCGLGSRVALWVQDSLHIAFAHQIKYGSARANPSGKKNPVLSDYNLSSVSFTYSY